MRIVILPISGYNGDHQTEQAVGTGPLGLGLPKQSLRGELLGNESIRVGLQGTRGRRGQGGVGEGSQGVALRCCPVYIMPPSWSDLRQG